MRTDRGSALFSWDIITGFSRFVKEFFRKERAASVPIYMSLPPWSIAASGTHSLPFAANRPKEKEKEKDKDFSFIGALPL